MKQPCGITLAQQIRSLQTWYRQKVKGLEVDGAVKCDLLIISDAFEELAAQAERNCSHHHDRHNIGV